MTEPDTLSKDVEALQQFVLDSIPLARAMQLQMTAGDGHSLRLRAPLAPNVNDKGCAFGGSLSGLLTLAGWSLLVLALKRRGNDADVFVASAEIKYLSPLFEDIEVSACLAPEQTWSRFFRSYDQRGKARVQIESHVHGEVGPVCIQSAQFVAKRRHQAQ